MTAREDLMQFYARTQQYWTANENGQKSPSRFVLDIAYSTSQILLHRPFLREFSPVTARIATEATATASLEVARSVALFRKSYSFANAPAFVLFHLLRAAIAQLFICLLRPSSGRRQPSVTLKVCLVALEEMYSTWPTRAAQAIHLVREVAARWKVTWALPMHHSNAMMDGNRLTPS